MSLVWSVRCAYELALILTGLLLIFLEHVCLLASERGLWRLIWSRFPRSVPLTGPMIISVSDPAEFVFVANPSAVRVGDSLVEALADQVVESTATGKHDLADGIVAVCHPPSVESFGGRAHASSSATAGDGNRSRLLEVIESVFVSLRSCVENSSPSSLRVSSHTRAREICLAAASACLSDPHSAFRSLPALTAAHADDPLMHVVLNSSRSDAVNSLTVQRCRKSATMPHGQVWVCRADRRYVASPDCWNISTVCRHLA